MKRTISRALTIALLALCVVALLSCFKAGDGENGITQKLSSGKASVVAGAELF